MKELVVPAAFVAVFAMVSFLTPIKHRKLRLVVTGLGLLLPNRLKLGLYRRLLGWRVGRNVRFGVSFIDSLEVELGDDVYVGHFNYFKHLNRFVFGAGSCMMNFNQGTASDDLSWARSLEVGERCGVMSHHFFDTSGGITIGEGVTLAGRGTQIWTHERSRRREGMVTKPVAIGDSSYIAAAVLIAPGTTIGPDTLAALGCVVKRGDYPENVLLVGNPTIVKPRPGIGEA